ncbi:MAG: V-type ATP synthase subunit D [Huintestinicola sp.]|uniref:V-type ATP synthase subunit D n=1 Tax=Huintestinicola sp. TaxID=2981661 RepID=UPI003EFD0E07
MADQVFPTKGNLLNVKKSLMLAKVGYELLDRKRNVLIRELMMMVDAAKALRGSITDTYKDAYAALQRANITMGLISRVAEGMPIEQSVSVTYRSVMGCELPKVSLGVSDNQLTYGFENTDGNVDMAYICFNRVKQMTAMLAEVDNSVFRLANAIKKTQTRANALKNIVIPKYESTVKFIENSLEEKEREEFSRQKVIKAQKERRKLRGRKIPTERFSVPDVEQFRKGS